MFHNVSHVGPVNVRYVPLEWESNLIFNLGRHQKPKGISISLNFFPVHFWCLALPPIQFAESILCRLMDVFSHYHNVPVL